MAEHVLILWIAGSNHNNLCEIIHQAVNHIIDQIQTFLIGES